MRYTEKHWSSINIETIFTQKLLVNVTYKCKETTCTVELDLTFWSRKIEKVFCFIYSFVKWFFFTVDGWSSGKTSLGSASTESLFLFFQMHRSSRLIKASSTHGRETQWTSAATWGPTLQRRCCGDETGLPSLVKGPATFAFTLQRDDRFWRFSDITVMHF